MFKNIGKKIKVFAKVICWLGIIFSVISGIILIVAGVNNDDIRTIINGTVQYMDSTMLIVLGVVVLILGPIVSWIGSFMTYGFGEIVDNTQAIKNKIAPEQISQPYYPQQPTYNEAYNNQTNYQNPQQ